LAQFGCFVSVSSQQLESSVEISAPVKLAYALWSDCENFPTFMHGVQAVHRIDPRHLHWRAELMGVGIEWDAEIIEDIPNARISWRAITGDPVAGTITFTELNPQRVRLIHSLQMEAEESDMASIRLRVSEDLERFKDFVESRAKRTIRP
jgi:uncharacterized membrane protein